MHDMVPALHPLPQLVPTQRVAMLRFMALLPVSSGDLETLVEKAVDENPVLERLPGRLCGTCGGFTRASRCDVCATAPRTIDVAAVVDWREDLRRQARLELPRGLLGLLDRLIASLDDRGLLRDRVEAPAADLEAVVAVLRAVGPPGIATGSATEAVRLQVASLAAAGDAPAALPAIVEGWLPHVAERRFAEIAAGLGLDEPQVAAAVAYLVGHTRPFVSLTDVTPRTGTVDVVFSLADDGGGSRLAVHVPHAEALGLRVTDDFGDLGATADAWLAPHRRAAAQLLAAVDARAEMLRHVASLLAEWQASYILHGPAAHRPVRRTDVAEQLSVHPSTVGRAVSGKTARCPDGRVVRLGDFFGAGPSTRARVASVIRDCPDATDATVAAELAHRGTPVARRTVSKYRSLLRLSGDLPKPSSSPA